ncbi:DUF502 domain-containing protein [Thermodesulfobacteriota bacterium]
MKQITEFLKTTIVGGLFVLLPVLLIYLLLSEALELVVVLATPIADLFPKGTFDKAATPVLFGLALIVGVSFVIGLVLRSETGKRLGRWIERATLDRLPGYTVLKSLTGSFKGTEEGGAFRPALVTSPDGTRELGYVVEEHPDGYVTVLLPWAPTPFAGVIKIVEKNRVELLDTNLAKFTETLSHWGMGARGLLRSNAM